MEYKSRAQLYKHLSDELIKIAQNRTKSKEILDTCYTSYGIPQSTISDYIYGYADIEDIDENLLWPVSMAIIGEKVDEYLPPQKNYKYKRKKIINKFENINRVASDQWTGGVIDIADFINLYNAGKIRYNPETQRPLKISVHGEIETFHFFKNNRAIKEMVEALQEDNFIPNTITLNVLKENFEGDINDYYDESRHELFIKDIDHFDLLDGYHRFLALQKMKLTNPTFEFKMELRITNFTIEKAKQFIYQEDQKTKMTKLQSSSYNTTNLGNQIVDFLKQNINLKPYISKNGGVIEEPFLSRAINDICIETPPTTNSQKIKLKKEISEKVCNGLINMIEADPDILDKKWDRDFIASVIWCCQHYKGDDMIGCVRNLYSLKGDTKFTMSTTLRGLAINTNNIKSTWENGGKDYV